MNNFTSDINPKNYYGFALDKDMINDKRQEKWQQERLERGFDDTEVWDLDCTIVKFALPRIKNLLEIETRITEHTEGGLKRLEDLKNLISILENFKINTDLSLFFRLFQSLWY